MKHTAPVWSMRGRTAERRIESVPGPGSYSPTKSAMAASPNYRLGTSKRRGLCSTSLTPGPGAYSLSRTTGTPSWSFFGRSNRINMSKSIETPGPGTYTCMSSPASPKFSVGKGLRKYFEGDSKSPGPGSYNPAIPAFQGKNLFGRAKRTEARHTTEVPGPGEYRVCSAKDGPSYSFRPKTSYKLEKKVPGPGNYEPKIDWVKEKAPSWVLGREGKSAFGKTGQAVPGPGTYMSLNSNNGPKWGFGSSKRERKVHNKVPGPGTYEIKSTVGMVPAYLQL